MSNKSEFSLTYRGSLICTKKYVPVMQEKNSKNFSDRQRTTGRQKNINSLELMVLRTLNY